MSVVILYGTESGNAEIVADSVADVLTDYDPSIYDMSDYAVEDLDAADFTSSSAPPTATANCRPAPNRSPKNSTRRSRT